MGPTPFYGARAEKNPFAVKQTNICRLSGDINNCETAASGRRYVNINSVLARPVCGTVQQFSTENSTTLILNRLGRKFYVN